MMRNPLDGWNGTCEYKGTNHGANVTLTAAQTETIANASAASLLLDNRSGAALARLGLAEAVASQREVLSTTGTRRRWESSYYLTSAGQREWCRIWIERNTGRAATAAEIDAAFARL